MKLFRTSRQATAGPKGHLQRSILGALALISLLIVTVITCKESVHATASVPDEARTGYETIRTQNLKAILNFIASDELEGRDTGQRGLKIAAKFLQTQFEMSGLTPPPGSESMLQRIPILKCKIDPTSSITLKSTQSGRAVVHEFSMLDDFVVNYEGSRSRVIEGPVTFAGFGTVDEANNYDDFKGIDAAGKIVMMLSGYPVFSDSTGSKAVSIKRSRRFRQRATVDRIKKTGATALLIIDDQSLAQSSDRRERTLNRTYLRLADEPDELPKFYISEKLANALLLASGFTVSRLQADIVASMSPISFHLRETTFAASVRITSEALETQNVVAFLEGSDPPLRQEVLAFSAHYDHVGVSEQGEVYNGADDDGSGTAALVEIARAFAANPTRPRRSLMFVAHAGEERGLVGSKYYTANALVPLEKTVALLNMDMIGRNEPNLVYVIGSNFLSKELHELNEAANLSVGLELNYKYNTLSDPNRFYFRSDHFNYAKQGIPIVFYFSGLHEDYHKITDTVDKINFHKIQKIAQLVYLTGWKVANLDQRPKLDGDFPTPDED